MDQQLEQILQDLYAIDPGLKQHETKLRKILAELIASKPDVHADAEFAQKVRRLLVVKATVLTHKQTNHMNDFIPAKGGSAFGGKKWNYILSGVLAVSIVMVSMQYYNQKGVNSPEDVIQLLSGQVEISTAQSEAFGNLNSASLISGRGKGGGGNGGLALNSLPENTNTGNAATVAPAPDAQSKMAYGSGGGDMAIVPAYQPFKFVYKGGDLPGLTDTQSVLRRVNASANQSSAASLIKKFSFGLIDINKFKEPKLQNFTLSEDREFGYTITADLTQSSVNISQNWEKWPHPGQDCRDEACYLQYRIKVSEVPSDAEVIVAANRFMSEYGVSLSGYGEPMVISDWKLDYERSTDKDNYYIPEQVTVIYPLELQGKTVLDEGGNPTGIAVSVDIRTKKAANVFGLFNRKFEQSSYVGETDSGRIIKLAEQGGFRSYLPFAAEGSGEKGVTVELDTPTVELVQIWKYDSYTSQELFVPALVFPVKTPDKVIGGYYLPKRVVVPLVKELLDNNPGGPIRIMDSVPPSGTIAPAAPAKEPATIQTLK